MTVIENLNPRVQYTYATTSQQYPITFPYIERPYVKCMINDMVLTYNVHYSIPPFDAEALEEDELYLTLLITPTSNLGDGVTVSAGDKITIYRATPLDQQSEFPQTAKFSSQKIMEALDKLTHQQQEQQDDLSICLKVSKNIPVGFNTSLPAPEAGKFLKWNEDGTAIINGTESALQIIEYSFSQNLSYKLLYEYFIDNDEYIGTYMECWGRVVPGGSGWSAVTGKTDSGLITVTFPYQFADTNFHFERDVKWTQAGAQVLVAAGYSSGFHSKTRSTITFGSLTSTYVDFIDWKCEGYVHLAS